MTDFFPRWFKGFACLTAVALFWAQDAHIDMLSEKLAASERLAADRAVAIEQLEQSLAVTEQTISAWAADRAALDALKAETRRALEALSHDKNFQAWSEVSVPADAVRLLRSGSASHAHTSTGGTAPTLSAATGTGDAD